MMRNKLSSVAAMAGLAFSGQALALGAWGITADGQLVKFGTGAPQNAVTVGSLNGFTGNDTALVGVDFRVQDGKLYGVGNAGGVYLVSRTNARVFLVNNLTENLSGTRFGVDFNPAADRLRIVSDTGQNPRHNINSGGTTTPDLALNYTSGVTATGVVGAAYTNNDLDANTATTLFVIDGTLDQVAIQAPPNNGSLNATGKLGVDATGTVGFDVYTVRSGGATTGHQGYAVINDAGGSHLASINLLTGQATALGDFALPVVDIALPIAP